MVLMGAFLVGCANVVTPTGGPKDVTPPVVVEAIPANRSVQFEGRKIELTFDEFISLENANQNLLFSPPLTPKPEVKLKNKTVVIRFKEDLKPNTTYTISFGNAIKDYHEGNLFNDYQYTFSTGEVLDTFTLAGTVRDAESMKPVPDLYVSLYDGSADSLFHLPTRQAPAFLAKTDKDGAFLFNGLPEGDFLVFALQDVNANLYYDMPNEKVAFLDTLVHVPALEPAGTEDSVPTFRPVSLNLYAFTEIDTNQMVLEKKLISEGVLRFVFRHPAHLMRITADTLPASDSSAFRIIEKWTPNHDTLYWYFTPGLRDSLTVTMRYDTLINIKSRFYLHYRENNLRASQALKVSSNIRKGLLMPGEDLLLHFPEPVTQVLWNDSLYDFSFIPNDEQGLTYRLVEPIDDTARYSIKVSDSVFYSVTGRTNDSISLIFRRANENDLGNLMITVQPPADRQVVVQLLNSRNAVVATRIVSEEQRVEFRNLLPEKYSLRAILDTDRNERWSTGNFHNVFIPETIIDYPDPLEIQAGWDIDLDTPWILY